MRGFWVWAHALLRAHRVIRVKEFKCRVNLLFGDLQPAGALGQVVDLEAHERLALFQVFAAHRQWPHAHRKCATEAGVPRAAAAATKKGQALKKLLCWQRERGCQPCEAACLCRSQHIATAPAPPALACCVLRVGEGILSRGSRRREAERQSPLPPRQRGSLHRAAVEQPLPRRRPRPD